MFDPVQVEDAYAVALGDAREFVRATDERSGGAKEEADFGRVVVAERVLDGVLCEVECSITVTIKRDAYGGIEASCACMASISPADGGPCYGQGLVQVAGLSIRSGPSFEPGEAWESALAEARAELSTDESFQAQRALAEAESLRASLREAPKRRHRPL